MPRRILSRLHVALLCLLALPLPAQRVAGFFELDAGRAPLTSEIDGASSNIDVYLFVLTDPGIIAAINNATARGVAVRAILEPCPGDTGCSPPNSDAMTGCKALLKAGAQVKWANQAFPKTHAKTAIFDNTRAWVTTINLESKTFATRRDYGLLTDEPGVIRDFKLVFQQDWQSGDPLKSCSESPSDRAPSPGVQTFEQLVVSPDHGRDQILGFIASARKSLKIQVEQIDPQNSHGVIPALVAAIQRGVQLQLLVSQPADQDGVQQAADAITAAGGRAQFQAGLKPHAKIIIADGERMFVGSQNLTSVSLDQRREIGWIVSDPSVIACFGQVFDADWSGVPLTNAMTNSTGYCPAAAPSSLTISNSASYASTLVAPDSDVAIFGTHLATRTASGASQNLPTSLAGTVVQITDSAGTTATAPLMLVSPRQVNLTVPSGLANGMAKFAVISGDDTVSMGTQRIVAYAPGLYSMDGSGHGLAAADVLTVDKAGRHLTNASQPIVVDAPGTQVFLTLFGTGIRHAGRPVTAHVSIGGQNVPIVFAGPQGILPGVDQINLILPATLAGKGLATVTLTVGTRSANPVQIMIK